MNILYIDSSITGDASASRELTAAIVASLKDGNGDAEVTYRDLAAEPFSHLTLPAFGEADSAEALAQFKAADTVVIGAPMYNFTIPSQLKAWIDRILVAGETFRYSEAGPEGLAGGKRVIVAVSRGGHYAPGTPTEPLEHLETYLRAVFGFIGIVPQVIAADGIAIGPDNRAVAVTGALEAAAALAA